MFQDDAAAGTPEAAKVEVKPATPVYSTPALTFTPAFLALPGKPPRISNVSECQCRPPDIHKYTTAVQTSLMNSVIYKLASFAYRGEGEFTETRDNLAVHCMNQSILHTHTICRSGCTDGLQYGLVLTACDNDIQEPLEVSL